MKKRLTWYVAGSIGTYLLLKRLGTRSGATSDEASGALPGDEIVHHPMIETTHAVTIHAPASTVWRWLIQCGYRGSGRAGWYTDSPIDPLLEKVVFRSTVPEGLQPDERWRHSADELLPDFAQTSVGDIIPDGPPGSAFFTVMEADPERAWVLYSDSHPKYLVPRFLHGTSMESYGEFTWVFVLRPIAADLTRLILRTRMRYGPPLVRRLLLPVVYAGEAIFPRLLLNGLKRRAEKSGGEDRDTVQPSHPDVTSKSKPMAVIAGG
jgi:hypothetical protein